MSTRFEILRNGERVCVSGIDGDGVLSVNLSYVNRADDNHHRLSIGGLGYFDGSTRRQQHAHWPAPEVSFGDEITIRILAEGDFDPPLGLANSPKKTVDDPDLGRMSYFIDVWTAEVPFDSAPIQTAQVRIRADESGPTKAQRSLLHSLAGRHADLWPQLLVALTRCHPDIDSPTELARRVLPEVEISMGRDLNRLDLCYQVDGDPEHRSYFVTLRNWQVAEIGMAE